MDVSIVASPRMSKRSPFSVTGTPKVRMRSETISTESRIGKRSIAVRFPTMIRPILEVEKRVPRAIRSVGILLPPPKKKCNSHMTAFGIENSADSLITGSAHSNQLLNTKKSNLSWPDSPKFQPKVNSSRVASDGKQHIHLCDETPDHLHPC